MATSELTTEMTFKLEIYLLMNEIIIIKNYISFSITTQPYGAHYCYV